MPYAFPTLYKVEFSENGKKAGIIRPEDILLDSDGNFWRCVGHTHSCESIQRLGWMTPPPSDPFAVAGAAYFLTRSVFFFRGGLYWVPTCFPPYAPT